MIGRTERHLELSSLATGKYSAKPRHVASGRLRASLRRIGGRGVDRAALQGIAASGVQDLLAGFSVAARARALHTPGREFPGDLPRVNSRWRLGQGPGNRSRRPASRARGFYSEPTRNTLRLYKIADRLGFRGRMAHFIHRSELLGAGVACHYSVRSSGTAPFGVRQAQVYHWDRLRVASNR